MKLKVVGSSSSGNCYFLVGKRETLMIECGVRTSKAFEAIDFNTKNLVGCLVSHEHGDHAKYSDAILNAGIPLFASQGTISKLVVKDELSKLSAHPVAHGEVFKIGEFKVMAFKTEHDCAEPLGFLIDHPEVGRIVFATDTYFVKYRFKNVSVMMIEANYSEKILQHNLDSGKLHPGVGKRVRKSHFEINDTIEFIKANDNPELRKVILLHLSDGNANAAQFESMVTKNILCDVHIADKGKEIDLNLF